MTIPLPNDLRYEVMISSHQKNSSYIVYEIQIMDLAFQNTSIIYRRYKELKKFHEALINLPLCELVPEFPKTHSLLFWNKTNEDPKKISERKREITFYLEKVLNIPQLRGHRLVK